MGIINVGIRVAVRYYMWDVNVEIRAEVRYYGDVNVGICVEVRYYRDVNVEIRVEVKYYEGCQCGNSCRGKVLQTMGDVDVGICQCSRTNVS